jgi:thioredoxin-related protein
MNYFILILLSLLSIQLHAQSFKFEETLEEDSNIAEATTENEVSEVNLISWLVNLDEAKNKAARENKPILMYFTGSDWCPPCIALKNDFFASEKFQKEYVESFVFVMIDYPRRKDILSEQQLKYNRTIIDKYNPTKTFPKVLVLNENGEELGKISGYSSYSSYKDTSHHFKFVAKFIAK